MPLVAIVFGWPAAAASVLLGVVDDVSRRWFLLLIGLIVGGPFLFYLSLTPPNCSDIIITEIGQSPNLPDVWRAIAGTLEVERGPKGVRPEEPWLFKATLRLSNASFRGRQGTVVEMREVFT